MPGWHILDSALIVNVGLDSWNKDAFMGVLCKLRRFMIMFIEGFFVCVL